MTDKDSQVLRALAFKKRAEELHGELSRFSYEISQSFQSGGHNSYTDEQLADIGFSFRKVELALDEARRESLARQKMVSNVLAIRVAKRAIIGKSNGSVRTKHCTATPDVRQKPSLPKRGTEDWYKLVKAMGVDGVALERNMVTLHWPTMVDWVTEHVAAGRPLPVDVKLGKTETSVTYRERDTK